MGISCAGSCARTGLENETVTASAANTKIPMQRRMMPIPWGLRRCLATTTSLSEAPAGQIEVMKPFLEFDPVNGFNETAFAGRKDCAGSDPCDERQ
jgi:hypothetical protein